MDRNRGQGRISTIRPRCHPAFETRQYEIGSGIKLPALRSYPPPSLHHLPATHDFSHGYNMTSARCPSVMPNIKLLCAGAMEISYQKESKSCSKPLPASSCP